MKTVRRPPYPKWNPGYFPCSSLTPPSAFLTPSIGVLRWIRAKGEALRGELRSGENATSPPDYRPDGASYHGAERKPLSHAAGKESRDPPEVYRNVGGHLSGNDHVDETGPNHQPRKER